MYRAKNRQSELDIAFFVFHVNLQAYNKVKPKFKLNHRRELLNYFDICKVIWIYVALSPFLHSFCRQNLFI